MLRLPRILYLTLRKCCACHKTCTWPCENAAPATKSALDLAKVLRLPRNIHLTLRKCCACHAIQTLGKLDLAKALRLPRILHTTLPKCCACHAIQTLRNLRPDAGQARFRISGDANSRTGLPHARAFFLAGLFLLLSFFSESLLSVSCRNTEVPSKLPLTIAPSIRRKRDHCGPPARYIIHTVDTRDFHHTSNIDILDTLWNRSRDHKETASTIGAPSFGMEQPRFGTHPPIPRKWVCGKPKGCWDPVAPSSPIRASQADKYQQNADTCHGKRRLF